MTVQIIISGDGGADAVRQLLDLANAVRTQGAVQTAVQSLKEKAAAAEDNKPAPAAPKAAETKQEPAPAQAAAEKPVEEKPVDKAEDKKAEEPAKEEPVSARRQARGSKAKESKATPETKADAPAAATAAPEFTAPAGFNDAVKANGAATEEVIKAAMEKVDQFRPKEGEAVSLNYCRALLLFMAAKKGMDYNRKMLEKFGVKKIQDLSAERFGDFANEMSEALKA